MNEIEIKVSKELIDYESSLKFMKLRVNQIQNSEKTELLWFLNHNHIYTQGTSANHNEIIRSNGIKIINTNRGGKTTYHGPGQRIVYFMINLNKRKKDIRKFINIIENSLLEHLKKYSIDCATYRDRVGIWATGKNGNKFSKEKKIGAIGLRVKKWVTYHGLSVNIKPDLQYYEYINACGLNNYKNTSLYELGIEIDEPTFDREYSTIFLKNLNKLK